MGAGLAPDIFPEKQWAAAEAAAHPLKKLRLR
jgi:hypothetical protein